MTVYSLPYGISQLRFQLPGDIQAEVISPRHIPAAAHPLEVVRKALTSTVGSISLSEFIGVRTAAIAINDKTRPVPHHDLLPPLLDQLRSLGIPDTSVTLWIATGAHPPMTADEFDQVVPAEVLRRCQVFSHDCDDVRNLIYLGSTHRQTPVWVNRSYADADLRIAVGNIEPHQFQGFSGGSKSVAIGLAGRTTINHNHAMMTEPLARLGEYAHNPAREDVEEIGRLIGIHFALNAILNDKKELVKAFAGHPEAVMQAGIPLARRICQVQVRERFDLMIVSPGGHPKDINIYQTQKALAHAALVTRKGGAIILAAACPEGAGSESYVRWVQQHCSMQQVISSFASAPFLVGPHKAYQIARDATRFQVRIISQMNDDYLRRLLFSPAPNIDIALAELLPSLPRPARIGIMPIANTTIPDVQADHLP
ncbi:MAG: nickel-dependent lactate racemase [Chloroflexi bacterium]|nr:nickel-dependent lactate racemase [Chloroflexota bacterium]